MYNLGSSREALIKVFSSPIYHSIWRVELEQKSGPRISTRDLWALLHFYQYPQRVWKWKKGLAFWLSKLESAQLEAVLYSYRPEITFWKEINGLPMAHITLCIVHTHWLTFTFLQAARSGGQSTSQKERTKSIWRRHYQRVWSMNSGWVNENVPVTNRRTGPPVWQPGKANFALLSPNRCSPITVSGHYLYSHRQNYFIATAKSGGGG